jgi:membrane-bound metal-dependent hydrolase YbcI (DUF457 family)
VPSPLGHGLAAATIHALTASDAAERKDPRRLLALVAIACLPDVDLLFRFVDGRFHHQGMTHSIGFALLAGAAAFAFARVSGFAPWRAAAVVAAAYASHVLLDLLGRDTHPPIGLRALWPFDGGFYKLPAVFLDIGRSLGWGTVVNNARAVALEAALLAPLTWLAFRFSARREA